MALVLFLVGCNAAPEHQATSHSPYAGAQDRTIKALSSEDVKGYLSGQGMGFAMAAELNSYPGPRHVLELADDLNLTEEQHAQTQAFFDEMQTEAIRLGEQLVAQEEALDALFSEKNADAEALRAVLQQIGALRADLRFVHLNAHLQVRALLNDQQVHHYDMLRGYNSGDSSGQHDHSQHTHSS